MTAPLIIPVRGYVTQNKFIVGRTLAELERSLGFHEGRLRQGATFVRLSRLPAPSEFELAAYSMTAQHRYAPPTGLDVGRLKSMAQASWTLTGPGCLVKVLPDIRHDPGMPDDEQYPPGSGVPQWRITVEGGIAGVVVAVVGNRMDRFVWRPGS